MKAQTIGIILLASSTLVACSGSTTDSTATSAASKISITTSNQSAVANSAISAAGQSLGTNNLSFVGGVQTYNNSNNDRLLFNMADFALQQMSEPSSAPTFVSGVSTPITRDCKTLAVSTATTNTYTIDTDSTTAATRSFYKVTYNSCLIFGITFNGTMNITNVTHANPFQATLDFNLTMATTGNPTLSLIGGYSISASGVGTTARTDTVSGTSIALSAGTANFSLTNFNFTSAYNPSANPIIYTDNVNYTVAASDSLLTGSYSLATTPTNLIVKSSAAGQTYPRSGQVVIYGDNTTALRVTVVSTDPNTGTSSGTVTLEISTNTTPASSGNWSTPVTKTWAQISAGQ